MHLNSWGAKRGEGRGHVSLPVYYSGVGVVRPKTVCRKSRFRNSVWGIAVCVAFQTWPAGLAFAQDAVNDDTIDTIVVTARKIDEPIWQIPFGISVFGAEDIERRDIHDARSFGRLVPGFNFVDTGLRGSNIPNIRGTGSFFPQSSDDGSVPVFVDGVPVPLRAQDREFFDIQRIEILRGPQNTLYGRNAQAGAISIITADPIFEPEVQVGFEFGNFESRQVTGLLNAPLSEDLALRVAGQFDTRDGDIPDLNLGQDTRDQDLINIHGKLLWAPNDLTEVKLAVRYGNYDEEPTQGVLVENPDFPQLFLDTPFRYDFETLGIGLTGTRKLGRVTLTSITGYQDYTTEFLSDDTDGLVFNALTGFPPAFANNPASDFRNISDDGFQVSQEVRIDTKFDNGLQLVAGIFYFRSELDFAITFNATGFLNGLFQNDFTTNSYAGFAEVTAPLGERLRLIGGLRYTREKRDFVGTFQDLSGVGLVASSTESGDRVFNFVTGRAALTYDLSPTATAFASVARGAKSGGFQLTDTDVAVGFGTSQFDAAITWAYEAGVRGQIFDELLYLSASVFFNDTQDENLQVFDFTTFQSVIENADTESYGLEIEAVLQPTDNISVSGGFALTQTEITASEDPTVAAGNEVPFAPSFAFNLGGQYQHPLSFFGMDGNAFGRIEYQYVGERTSDPQNRLDVDSFDLVNIRGGLDFENLSIYTFATNLLKEDYAETAFLFGSSPGGSNVSLGIPGQPRRFGGGARIRF